MRAGRSRRRRHTAAARRAIVDVAETGGRLGFITPLTNNFCAGCNRIRVTATGQLYACLGGAGEGRFARRAAFRRARRERWQRRSTRRCGSSPSGTTSASSKARAPRSRATCRSPAAEPDGRQARLPRQAGRPRGCAREGRRRAARLGGFAQGARTRPLAAQMARASASKLARQRRGCWRTRPRSPPPMATRSHCCRPSAGG